MIARAGLWLGAAVLALASAGCGHGTSLRPAPEGAVRAEVALGGPIARVNSAITSPLPLVTAGASYGAGDRFDVSAHAHLTALAFGVAGLDVGSTALLLGGDRWALSGTGRLYGFTELSRGQPRAYLEAQLAPSVQAVPGGSPCSLRPRRWCSSGAGRSRRWARARSSSSARSRSRRSGAGTG